MECIIVGCKSNHDEFDREVTGTNYIPFTETTVWYDSIIAINIDLPSGVFDTLVQVQKTIVDSIVTQNLVCNIYCSRFLFSAGVWQFLNRFWYEKTETKLLRFEDNLLWLDFVFPIRQNIVWNAYAFNINSDTVLRNVVVQFNYPAMVNGHMYDSLMEIQHQMDSTLIFKRTDVSYYAAGAGFLYRQSINIISDDPNYDYTLPIEQRIKTATKLIIKRYSYER